MNVLKLFKLWFGIKDDIQKIKESYKMKNGIKTTEFWVTIINLVGTIVLTFIGAIPANILGWVVANWLIITAVYALVRSIVKSTKTTKDDVILANLEGVVKQILEKTGILSQVKK